MFILNTIYILNFKGIFNKNFDVILKRKIFYYFFQPFSIFFITNINFFVNLFI